MSAANRARLLQILGPMIGIEQLSDEIDLRVADGGSGPGGGVLTFGGQAGDIIVGTGLEMDGKTIKFSGAAGGVTSFGDATGDITLSTDFLMVGDQLTFVGGTDTTDLPSANTMNGAVDTVVVNIGGAGGTGHQMTGIDFINANTAATSTLTAVSAIADTDGWGLDQGGASLDRVTALQTKNYVRKGDHPFGLIAWQQGAIVANGTVTLVYKAGYGFTVDSLDYLTANGSFTANVQIVHSGTTTSVTSLAAVAVSSATAANVASTGANTVVAGDTLQITITSTASSPTGAVLNVNCTRT